MPTKEKTSAWQKAAWVVGFIVAATSVGLIPRLTDLQTVAAADKIHAELAARDEKLSEDFQNIRREIAEQRKETVQLLREIIGRLK